MRRGAGLWLVLFAIYATTLGLHAGHGQRYSAAESHRLMTAASLSSDGDLDLRDQYAAKTWHKWDGAALRPTSHPYAGRLVEAQGIGFELAITPAYAIGGATAVELECAALLALAFVLACALAGRLVPEPWATRGALAVGLSPPALVASTTIAPTAAGACVLAGAALLALRVRDRPETRVAFWSAALVATTPWIDLHLIFPAAVIALAVARWLRRRQRGLAGFVALEVVLTSAVVFVTVNDRLFGGLTPYASRISAGPVGGASSLADYLGRLQRIAGALIDRDAGLIRWAPVCALALVAMWLLVRSRRERIAVTLPERVDTEVSGVFLALIVGAALAGAVFTRPMLGADSLAAPDLVAVLPVIGALSAWGLRHVPRVGNVLVVVTLAFSVWTVVGARADRDAGVAPPSGALPLVGVRGELPALR